MVTACTAAKGTGYGTLEKADEIHNKAYALTQAYASKRII
jgi:hypothetical protein